MVSERFDQLSEQAKEAIESKDWEAARTLLQKALQIKSDAPDLHYNLATVSFQLEDLVGAAHHFKEVTRLDPLRAGAYINLGAVLNLLDRLDEAVEMLRRGLQLDPHRAEGYYNLGLVHRRKGQKDLALQAYREAVRVNPRMADSYYNMGNLLMDKEQYGQALAAYKQALQLRSNWDRAKQGYAKAKCALDASTGAYEPVPAPPPPPTPETDLPLAAKSFDPNRMVDPMEHGQLLTNLHRATIETENYSRHFLKLLEGEVEPVIKELSSCLLQPGKATNDLGQCVVKFEKAMNSMRGLQRELQSTMDRIKVIGDQLIEG
jgi:tetratricopeptide (TPR) repeat protein